MGNGQVSGQLFNFLWRRRQHNDHKPSDPSFEYTFEHLPPSDAQTHPTQTWCNISIAMWMVATSWHPAPVFSRWFIPFWSMIFGFSSRFNIFQPSMASWANYNNSPTWIKAIWGWFPLLTMISRARSQWGRDQIYQDPSRVSHPSGIDPSDTRSVIFSPRCANCEAQWSASSVAGVTTGCWKSVTGKIKGTWHAMFHGQMGVFLWFCSWDLLG